MPVPPPSPARVPPADDPAAGPRPAPGRPGAPRRVRRGALLLTALLLAVAATALGLMLWQIQRLQWKEALLARVDALERSAPAPAPGPAEWPQLDRARDEYRPLALQGQWDAARSQRRLASTAALGRGEWVMTPLRTEGGWWVWVNRGFVDSAHPPAEPAAGRVQLSGLLRASEQPLLALMAPASRDLDALNRAAGLPPDRVAPYFVDLRPGPAAPAEGWPRPGLTVLQFNNHHRGYALTWAALAAGALLGAALVWRQRHAAPPGPP